MPRFQWSSAWRLLHETRVDRLYIFVLSWRRMGLKKKEQKTREVASGKPTKTRAKRSEISTSILVRDAIRLRSTSR